MDTTTSPVSGTMESSSNTSSTRASPSIPVHPHAHMHHTYPPPPPPPPSSSISSSSGVPLPAPPISYVVGSPVPPPSESLANEIVTLHSGDGDVASGGGVAGSPSSGIKRPASDGVAGPGKFSSSVTRFIVIVVVVFFLFFNKTPSPS